MDVAQYIELDMRDETTIQAWRMQEGDKFCFFGSLTFVRCCWNPFFRCCWLSMDAGSQVMGSLL